VRGTTGVLQFGLDAPFVTSTLQFLQRPIKIDKGSRALLA